VRLWNATVGKLPVVGNKLKIDVPATPSTTPKVGEVGYTKAAAGALVRPRVGGTLLQVAEAGRSEAVLPLPTGFVEALTKLASGETLAKLLASQKAPNAGPLVGNLTVVTGAPADQSAFAVVRELNAERWRRGA
jgi:hypothetical protein